MNRTEEHARIQRTQNGDTEAFSPLVSKYQPRLYTHIHGRVKDADTAKDLTQETWFKVLRGINTFRCESAFSSWLYRIAENVCIDHFRKQKHDTDPLHLIDEHRITDTIPVRAEPSNVENSETPSKTLSTASQRHADRCLCYTTITRR